MNDKEKSTDVSKCPSCGANLVFNPAKQALKCEHCGTVVDFEKNTIGEQDFEKLKSNSWAEETHVFRCNNCGAKEVLAKTSISQGCSFCGTTNVVETDELAGLKPDAVVPYKLNKSEASDKVKLWAKSKLFAPKKFKQSAEAESISGTYQPTFTFDANTNSSYSGVLVKVYYETKTHNGKTTSVRRETTKHVSGVINKNFDDVTVQASNIIPSHTINKLLPFDTNNSMKYNKNFLFGYTATQYTKDGTVCFKEARQMMDARIRSSIIAKYPGYDTVRWLTVDTVCSNITYKYVLLPIYVGHCNYNQKLYNFYINGYNGKVTGKAPVSTIKVAIVATIIVLILGLIAWLVIANVHGNPMEFYF